jgi:DNA-directed RNA polymerase specialized sigma24 family protein
MNGLSDQQLLRDYVESRSETAFAELVRRHVGLVYSAAVRMVCDPHLAEDVSQGVFTVLARNAPTLTGHPVLCGWLHRTTRNLASKTVRAEVSRRAREQQAAAMNQLLSDQALNAYVQAHPETFPAEMSELKPHFAPPVDEDLLQHWKVAPKEELYCVGDYHSASVLTQKGPVDEDYDACFVTIALARWSAPRRGRIPPSCPTCPGPRNPPSPGIPGWCLHRTSLRGRSNVAP